MIVVDTNLIAYAVLPGDHAEAARRAGERDPAWLAPSLWRREFRNVLATAMRLRELPMSRALAAFAAAEGLVEDAEAEPSVEECLEVAARGAISAYDAEFVCVAERFDLLLVTADRKLARAFPGRAQMLDDFVAGR